MSIQHYAVQNSDVTTKQVTAASRSQTRPTCSDEGLAHQISIRVITSCCVISYFTPRGAPQDKGARNFLFMSQTVNYGHTGLWRSNSTVNGKLTSDEIFALLGCYTAQIGSQLSTFRDNLSVPRFRQYKNM